MTNYYLAINHDSNHTYLIGRFMETILVQNEKKIRQLHISLHPNSDQDGDSMLISLADFYAEDSITDMTVLGEDKVTVIYNSTNYNKVNSLAANLQNFAGSGEDSYQGMEYSITLESPVE